MMPLAPNPVMAMPTSKPKIGFSIESIVGEKSRESDIEEDDKQDQLLRPSMTEFSQSGDQFNGVKLTNDLQKALRLRTCSPNKIYGSLAEYNTSCSPTEQLFKAGSTENQPFKENIQTRTDIVNRSPSPPISANCLGNSPTFNSISTPPSSLLPTSKVPLIVPGISAGYMVPFSRHEFKPIPPYTPDVAPQHSSHVLAAQLTAAALSGQTFAPMHQQTAHLHGPSMPRDSYPLYPWLISRHGRIFPHRFPGSK